MKQDIERYQLVCLREALKLQKVGIRVNPFRAASTIARQQFGLKGNIDKLIDQVDRILDQRSRGYTVKTGLYKWDVYHNDKFLDDGFATVEKALDYIDIIEEASEPF